MARALWSIVPGPLSSDPSVYLKIFQCKLPASTSSHLFLTHYVPDLSYVTQASYGKSLPVDLQQVEIVREGAVERQKVLGY